MKLLRNKYFLLYLVIALFLSSFYINLRGTKTLADLSKQASQKLNEKYSELTDAAELARGLDPEKLQELYSTNEIGVYVFTNEKLAYWNNSQIPIPTKFTSELKPELVKLRNGYYLAHHITQGDNSYLALCILKTRYDLQNDYLKNNFAAWLDLPTGLDLKLSKIAGSEVNLNNALLFSISGSELTYKTQGTIGILTVLFFLICILLLLFVLLQIKREPFSMIGIVYVAFIFILRFLMLQFKWPGYLYQGDLYDLILF